MAEITRSRIESMSDPNCRPQDQLAQKPHAKFAAAGKPAPPKVPEVAALEELDKHELDEMA
jgi:hypothetical protein